MSRAIIEPPAGRQAVAMADLNDLYLFTLVVEMGSFTAASKAAGLTTSRISRRIADLEERLGVRLLHRTTRRLGLTSIGERYYQHCRAMVSEAEAAAEAIEQVQASPRGGVVVTCPVLTAQSQLSGIITGFMQRYPEVRLSLAATDRLVNLIDEGFDVAIRFRGASPEDPNLVARPLGKSRNHLLASPGFLDKHGRPAKPDDLPHLPSLSKSRHDRAYAWHLTRGDEARVVAYQPVLDADDWLVIKQAALAGLGMTAIPDELCLQEMAAGTLEAVLPGWELPGTNLYIVYTSRRGLIPAVRAFIDYAAERLSVVCSEMLDREDRASGA